MSRDDPQREFDEHMAEIHWMNVARAAARGPAPATSPLDDEWREVNRQLDWQASIKAARAERLRRPMAEVPATVDLGEILSRLGREVFPVEDGEDS